MTKEEIRKENIQKTIDAGILCFAEEGIANTQIQSVIRKAHISKRSFLRYFGSKDKFVIEVLKSVNIRCYVKGQECYKDIVQRYSSASDRLRALMMVTKDFFLAHPEIFILMSEGQAYVMRSAEKQAILTQYTLVRDYWPSVVLSLMRQGVAEGSITCFSAEQIQREESSALWYAYIGLMVQLAYSNTIGNHPMADCEKTIRCLIEQTIQSLN